MSPRVFLCRSATPPPPPIQGGHVRQTAQSDNSLYLQPCTKSKNATCITFQSNHHTTASFPLKKQLSQSIRLWDIISSFDPRRDSSHKLHQLLAVSFVLEELIQLATNSLSNFPSSVHKNNTILPPVIGDLLQFYDLPEISPSRAKLSSLSLTNQILSLA